MKTTKRFGIRIAAAALAVPVALSTVSVASAAEQNSSVKTETPQNMVSIVIPGIRIPGQPDNQILFPKLPTVEQVREESGKLATQLDKLLIEFNKFAAAQKKALGQLNDAERKLTDARNTALGAIDQFGKNSDEAKEAKKKFSKVRNEVKADAKDGDEEAKKALSDNASKRKQRAASASDMLKTRNEIADTVDEADIDEASLTDPEVTGDGWIGSEDEAAYYAAEDGGEEATETSTAASKPAAETTAAQSDDSKKKQRVDQLKKRAAAVFSPTEENAEDSALYAFGNYEKPVGVPSLLTEDEKEDYGNIAKINVRSLLNKAISEHEDLKKNVSKMREAEKNNDTKAYDAARAEIQPIADTFAELLYGWDDKADPKSDEYKTIIGDDGAPFDPNEDAADQAKFDQFFSDLITIPTKYAKNAEKTNESNVKKREEESDEPSED